MHQIHRNAETRLVKMAQERAEQYDSTLIHNRIHDSLPEDDDLREVADVMARAYELEREFFTKSEGLDDTHDRISSVAFGCAEGLSDELEALADEAEQELLKRTAENLGKDWHSDKDIALAREELSEAGVLSEVVR